MVPGSARPLTSACSTERRAGAADRGEVTEHDLRYEIAAIDAALDCWLKIHQSASFLMLQLFILEPDINRSLNEVQRDRLRAGMEQLRTAMKLSPLQETHRRRNRMESVK